MRGRSRRRLESGPAFQWKEPLGLVLVFAGVIIAVAVGLLLVTGVPGSGGNKVGLVLVLVAAVVLAVGGLYLVHLARRRPGWVFDPRTFSQAFGEMDDAALRDVARALSLADGPELDGVVRRATLGRFSGVLECVPGLCRRCARTGRTQPFLLFRALVVPVYVINIYVWEYLSSRLCRDCAGDAMLHFLGMVEGGGGPATLAGILWLPWNLPQYLWSRLLPKPQGEQGVPVSEARALAPRAPALVKRLRSGESLRELVEQEASRIGSEPGQVALVLVAYGELCRRISPRA